MRVESFVKMDEDLFIPGALDCHRILHECNPDSDMSYPFWLNLIDGTKGYVHNSNEARDGKYYDPFYVSVDQYS